MSMNQNKPLRTPDEYHKVREQIGPKLAKVIFVFESPPKSGLYFYDEGGKTTEPLFAAMMKYVLDIKPNEKREGLLEFSKKGFLLIDATYVPVNYDEYKESERNKKIMDDFPNLVRTLRKHSDQSTRLILVKSNICNLLDKRLTNAGFNVANQGRVLPFPSNGNQKRFGQMVRELITTVHNT